MQILMKHSAVPKVLVNKMNLSEFDAFVTITGFSHYIVHDRVGEGYEVLLVREPENPHDEYAIAVYSRGGKIGYVANRTDTVRKDTMSARQLAALMEGSVSAEIVDFSSYDAVCRVNGIYDIDKMCFQALKYVDNLEYDLALELFLVLNEKYDSEMVRRYTADCLIKLGRYGESLKYSEWILSEEPQNPIARMMHGVALSNTGRFVEAIADFTLLLEKHNNASVFRERAICYSKLGEAEKAKADLVKSIQLDPNNPLTKKVSGKIMNL